MGHTKKCQRYVRPKEHGSSLFLGAEKVLEHTYHEELTSPVLHLEGVPALLSSSSLKVFCLLFHPGSQGVCRMERAGALILDRCGFERWRHFLYQ